jgi:hypothetical protein
MKQPIPEDSHLRDIKPADSNNVACRNKPIGGGAYCVLPSGHTGVHQTAKVWKPKPEQYTSYWVRDD